MTNLNPQGISVFFKVLSSFKDCFTCSNPRNLFFFFWSRCMSAIADEFVLWSLSWLRKKSRKSIYFQIFQKMFKFNRHILKITTRAKFYSLFCFSPSVPYFSAAMFRRSRNRKSAAVPVEVTRGQHSATEFPLSLHCTV